MVQFHIQTDSDIPASTQLFNQIRFAIASRQFPPGHRLPSTRQLAMQTGLHRNTISKVYRQLENTGLVEAQAGSGIYVRAQGNEVVGNKLKSPILEEYPLANKIVQGSIDQLLEQGCTLNQARELFLAEIDWRLRCSARVVVTAPTEDIGVGELMAKELEQALRIPIQLVPMEQLGTFLDQISSGTVITSRYFIGEAESISAPRFGASDSRRHLRLQPGNPASWGFAERQLFGSRQPESGNAAIDRSHHPQHPGRGFAGDDGLAVRRLQD